jgi:hypothetical protein
VSPVARSWRPLRVEAARTCQPSLSYSIKCRCSFASFTCHDGRLGGMSVRCVVCTLHAEAERASGACERSHCIAHVAGAQLLYPATTGGETDPPRPRARRAKMVSSLLSYSPTPPIACLPSSARCQRSPRRVLHKGSSNAEMAWGWHLASSRVRSKIVWWHTSHLEKQQQLPPRVWYPPSIWTRMAERKLCSVQQRQVAALHHEALHHERALSVTQRALSVTQRALSVTQRLASPRKL